MSQPYAEVIGDPISQSKSPAIHKFWIDRSGLSADYRACHVTPADLADYISTRRKDSLWRGCNVTMPHKQAVIPFLERLDPQAEKIGAVNTIIPEPDGSLTGYNTDADGFLEPLRKMLGHSHLFRMARIIGTGGASRAIIVALAAHGFVIVLAGRNPQKAKALLDELDPAGEHHTAPLEHFASSTDFAFDDRAGCLDLVINASPLGMNGQPDLVIDFSHVPPGSIIYDIITDPVDTPLLKEAKTHGLQTINGLSMLIGQAAIAFEKFFDCAPDRDDDDALRAQLKRWMGSDTGLAG
ncbi:MAG: shikimate dehydrogenase [Sphingomonadaceae bacterium]